MPGPLHLPYDQVLPPCSFHFLPSSFHLYSSDSTSFPIRLLFRWAPKRRPFVARTGPLVSLSFMMYSLSSLLSILRKWCLFFLGNMSLLLPKLFLMLSNSFALSLFCSHSQHNDNYSTLYSSSLQLSSDSSCWSQSLSVGLANKFSSNTAHFVFYMMKSRS